MLLQELRTQRTHQRNLGGLSETLIRVGAILMLAAMILYSMTEDFAWRPGSQAQPLLPCAVGKQQCPCRHSQPKDHHK